MRNAPTHEDKFSSEKTPSLMRDTLHLYRGYEKKKIYAWVRSDGLILSTPDDDYTKISLLEKEMQKKCNEAGLAVRLVEFKCKETKVRICPPPDPEEEKIHGGSAIGGFSARTVDDLHSEFKRIFEKQYAAKDVKFWTTEDTAYAEYGNVRCWVTKSDDLGLDVEYNLRKMWKSYVTMVKMWNEEYHDVHLGDFFDGTDAVEEAFIAFIGLETVGPKSGEIYGNLKISFLEKYPERHYTIISENSTGFSNTLLSKVFG